MPKKVINCLDMFQTFANIGSIYKSSSVTLDELSELEVKR